MAEHQTHHNRRSRSSGGGISCSTSSSATASAGASTSSPSTGSTAPRTRLGQPLQVSLVCDELLESLGGVQHLPGEVREGTL